MINTTPGRFKSFFAFSFDTSVRIPRTFKAFSKSSMLTMESENGYNSLYNSI